MLKAKEIPVRVLHEKLTNTCFPNSDSVPFFLYIKANGIIMVFDPSVNRFQAGDGELEIYPTPKRIYQFGCAPLPSLKRFI